MDATRISAIINEVREYSGWLKINHPKEYHDRERYFRVDETFSHEAKVGILAKLFAIKLYNPPDPDIEVRDLTQKQYAARVYTRDLFYSGLIHDVGKRRFKEILYKNPLTEEEFNLIKQHVDLTPEEEMIVISMFGKPKFVRYHHENYDGSGYPEGLRGEAIPDGARALRIVDSVDAMSDGIRGEPKTIREALKEIFSLKNKWYDPYLVDVFVEVMTDEVIEVVQPWYPQKQISIGHA